MPVIGQLKSRSHCEITLQYFNPIWTAGGGGQNAPEDFCKLSNFLSDSSQIMLKLGRNIQWVETL